VLRNAKNNALQKGAREHCLFVKEIQLGKAVRYKRVDIKAKGKTGIRRTPSSSIRLILEEKSLEELYKLFITGHCPPGLASAIRKMLIEKGADFEEITRYSHVTTARGRFEQRKKLKFEVENEKSKLRKSMRKKIIRSLIKKIYIDQLAEKQAAETRKKEKAIADDELRQRLSVYRVNYANSKIK